MDVKVDFVPPSLINFISRQLIGNGFRLYQKVADSYQLYFFDIEQFCFIIFWMYLMCNLNLKQSQKDLKVNVMVHFKL
jgi:hypothetical protein